MWFFGTKGKSDERNGAERRKGKERRKRKGKGKENYDLAQETWQVF